MFCRNLRSVRIRAQRRRAMLRLADSGTPLFAIEQMSALAGYSASKVNWNCNAPAISTLSIEENLITIWYTRSSYDLV